MSDDGTRDVVQKYHERFPIIRLLDNPKGNTPAAMNVGIQNARGETIAIVGAHASYNKKYIVECVRHLEAYDADEAGAVAEYIPRQNTITGRAIVTALTHPLGAGANTRYKIGASEPVWVDTVSSGHYRRSVFERIGLFNEKLIHSQDIEFNIRLRQAGGKILLGPTGKIQYFSRLDVKSFYKHNFRNGFWTILPVLYTHIIPISWRHIVPLMFVCSILISALLGLFLSVFELLFIGILAVYLTVILIVAAQISWRNKNCYYFIVLPYIMAVLHVGYGLGSVWGCLRLIFNAIFWKRITGKIRFSSENRAG